MGPRPAVTTQTTKEVNQLPQSKKRRSSQKASDESGPDEQKDQPEPESQVQQSDDQPEPAEQAQSSEEEKSDDQPEAQAQSSEEEKPEASEQVKEPGEETEQPTVADVLKEREETVRFHNERTGGGDVHEGELQNQLDEHNERVGDASR